MRLQLLSWPRAGEGLGSVESQPHHVVCPLVGVLLHVRARLQAP